MEAQKRRIVVGKFLKQVWGGRKGDIAITLATITFDATRAVLSRNLEFIRSLRDGDWTSDEIGYECVGHDGPCEVYLTESMAAFFRLGDDEAPDFLVEQITQEMLDQAREEFGDLLNDEAVIELKMQVSYKLNGESAELMRRHLDNLVKSGISEGMLTGETAAEVAEHSMEVNVLPAQLTIIEEERHAA